MRNAVITNTRRALTSDFVRRDLRVAVVPWILARVVVVTALAVARISITELGVHGASPAAQGFFVWDGGWYRSIAEVGYASLPGEALRFFPLFPLLGRGLGWALLDHSGVALVILANVAALVAGALLHRLALRETNDGDLAARASWYLALFPASLALVLPYGESVLLVAAIGMFLGLRSQRWWVVVPLGIVAGLTRPLGVLLILPAAIEAARGFRSAPRSERVARVSAVVAPGIGAAAYLVWTERVYGGFLLPFDVQSARRLRGATVDPITHIVDAFGDALGSRQFGAVLYLCWVAIFLAVLVAVARRFAASYTAYAAAVILLGLTAENYGSFERYTYATFPVILGVAVLTRRKDVDRAVVTLGAAGLLALGVLAFVGKYVP